MQKRIVDGDFDLSSPGDGRVSHGGETKRPAGVPHCPDCKSRMEIKLVTPVLFASDVDEATYVCERCGLEAKRTLRRR